MRFTRMIVAALSLAAVVCHATQADDRLSAEARELFGALVSTNAAKLPQQTELGRALFWDKRISADGKTSCASCHLPEDGGADRRRFSPDARGKMTARNSQTVFNAMLQPALRWTGDRKSGAHQAERSLTGSMGFKEPEAVVAVLKSLGYEPLFKRAFNTNEAVTPANYAKALEVYQATLVTPAPFDRYLAGDQEALTATQRIGLKKFIQVGCSDCHKGPLLGGRLTRKFGVEKDYWVATKSENIDAGLFESTKAEADRYKFRVPMLRNIAATAPYFHDGSVAELENAVKVMADVQLGQKLGDVDTDAIVAFLRSLTGDVPAHFSRPTDLDAAATHSTGSQR